MRLQHETPDGLSHENVDQEAVVAHERERQSSGCLGGVFESYGALSDFEEAEAPIRAPGESGLGGPGRNAGRADA